MGTTLTSREGVTGKGCPCPLAALHPKARPPGADGGPMALTVEWKGPSFLWGGKCLERETAGPQIPKIITKIDHNHARD